MCFHISNHQPKQSISKAFQKELVSQKEWTPAFHQNGFDKPWVPVISTQNPELISLYRWRLIPYGVKAEEDFTNNTLNARAEDIYLRAAYKGIWHQRCLVICTGFFEPHKTSTGQKQAFYIFPKNQEFFTLAGIWSDALSFPSFSILTRVANEKLAQIHNEKKRMPLILDSKMSALWLDKNIDKTELLSCFQYEFPNEEIEANRVKLDVLNARKNSNHPEVIQPYCSNEGSQSSLF